MDLVGVRFGPFALGRGSMDTWASDRTIALAKPSRRRRPPSGDIALVWGKNADGVHILRRRDENAPVEAGLLQPLVEGRPITGELISMRQREDMPFLYDVKSELPRPSRAPRPARRRSRPSHIARAGTPSGADANSRPAPAAT
jgi:hypothetical protein